MRFKLLAVMTFFVMCSFPTLSAADQENDSIVVWRIEPKTGVTDKEADAISGIVTAEVGRVSGRKTVGENEMKALIIGEEMKLSCGAEDTACVAEIGAALGAPESVTGTISKMGDYWILTLQRLNVRNVEVISRYENRVKGDVNMIVEMIAPAVRELFEIKDAAKDEKIVKKEKKPKKKMSVLMKSGIGVMVAGGVVLAFGGIATWRTIVEKENYQEGKTDGDMSKYNAWKYTSITSYTVGGVAFATGVALQIADVFIDAPVKTAVIPVPGGAHVYLSWRW
ncbi:MAG TPA: hypothetical protein PL195_01280 [bacterium]|nr:hypothetical protein [bacterium]HQJ60593.1 hypothetical protein [bacterium]